MVSPEKKPEIADSDDFDPMVYEVSFWLAPLIPEEDISRHVSEIKEEIEQRGGKIITEEFPKMKNIAYPMQGIIEGKKHLFTTGYFGWMKFEIAPGSVAELAKWFKEQSRIIRHLIITTVRENTLMWKPSLLKRDEDPIKGKDKKAPSGRKKQPSVEKEKEDAVITDEELDKTIDELVVE